MKVLLTIGDHLTRIEMMHRDRVALVDESGEQTSSWGEITYARLVELVRAQAAGLDRLGVGRSDPVAVLTRSSARLLTSFLAISGTGRVLLPVDFRMSIHDIADVIDHSGATTVLVDPQYDNALFHGLATQHLVLGTASDAELYRFGVETEPWEPDDDAIAILEYANEATAPTEPVALTHGDLRADLAAFGWQLDLSERDVYLHTVPLCHTRTWGLVYALTAMGGRHVAFDTMDGLEILRRIDAYGVTLVDGAPALGMTVLGAAASWDGPVPGRDRLRVVLTGAPPPTTQRLDTELGWELVQVDGLAEPSPISTPRDRGTDDEMQPPAAGMAAGT